MRFPETGLALAPATCQNELNRILERLKMMYQRVKVSKMAMYHSLCIISYTERNFDEVMLFYL